MVVVEKGGSKIAVANPGNIAFNKKTKSLLDLHLGGPKGFQIFTSTAEAMKFLATLCRIKSGRSDLSSMATFLISWRRRERSPSIHPTLTNPSPEGIQSFSFFQNEMNAGSPGQS